MSSDLTTCAPLSNPVALPSDDVPREGSTREKPSRECNGEFRIGLQKRNKGTPYKSERTVQRALCWSLHPVSPTDNLANASHN